MNTLETGQATHSAINPPAPIAVEADYTDYSTIPPETGLADYAGTPVSPATGIAIANYS